LHAFGESVVPRVTLITRRAYGGAYVAMNSKSLGATRVFAWPQAEVSVMGAVAAVRVLHRRLLADIPAEQRESMELELAAEHEKVSGGVLKAIEIGAVDEMLSPAQTRSALAKTIANAPHRRGSHGNIPL
jgi:acetyl-CoA/propionyl-CoA carboxylase carboxyl transferase subunit